MMPSEVGVKHEPYTINRLVHRLIVERLAVVVVGARRAMALEVLDLVVGLVDVKRSWRAHGQERIELENGSVLSVVTTTRGMSLDLIVLVGMSVDDPRVAEFVPSLSVRAGDLAVMS